MNKIGAYIVGGLMVAAGLALTIVGALQHDNAVLTPGASLMSVGCLILGVTIPSPFTPPAIPPAIPPA